MVFHCGKPGAAWAATTYYYYVPEGTDIDKSSLYRSRVPLATCQARCIDYPPRSQAWGASAACHAGVSFAFLVTDRPW
jgi:hypothetical protein